MKHSPLGQGVKVLQESSTYDHFLELRTAFHAIEVASFILQPRVFHFDPNLPAHIYLLSIYLSEPERKEVTSSESCCARMALCHRSGVVEVAFLGQEARVLEHLSSSWKTFCPI